MVLQAWPWAPLRSPKLGLSTLDVDDTAHNAWLYVPVSYRAGVSMPLVVALYGAGMSANGMLRFFSPLAEERKFVLLALHADDVTTHRGSGRAGFMDRALRRTFELCSVDPARIVIAGFSDAAERAHDLGASNRHLFSRIAMFPGRDVGAPAAAAAVERLLP